ncbi:hypothetical protein GC174_14240 [bacterium]|nr:hypothetical protein [bacterium]
MRGKSLRCYACNCFISRYSPTPLSTFTLKESAPVGFVTFRTDHLLLERVLTRSLTDRLIWQSPCKQGDCVHAEKIHDNGKSKEASEPDVAPVIAGDDTASEAGVIAEVKPNEEKVVVQRILRGGVDGDVSSWVLTICGVDAEVDGMPTGIVIATEDLDADPLPSAQSFSATTLVFGPALDERVVTAELEDLAPLYKKSLEERAQSGAGKEKESTAAYPEPQVFMGTFEEVKKTASAIFGETDSEDARGLSEALQSAIKSGDHTTADHGTAGGSPGGDDWPDDIHRRGEGRSSVNDNSHRSSSQSPYKSQFDLSAIKRPGEEDDEKEGRFQRGAMFQKQGSIVGTLIKLSAAVLVFVVIGLVGLAVLGGGSSSSVADGGAIKQNELGLPDLSGNWQIKLWVETESGNVGFGEIEAKVKQSGKSFSARGKDGNGNFDISGDLGQDEQVTIVFVRSYDVSDSRQHPLPIRFRGVVGASRGSEIIAQGSFVNRLMQDMPQLGKHKFENINGYWSLTIAEESPLDKARKMLGI